MKKKKKKTGIKFYGIKIIRLTMKKKLTETCELIV